MQKSIIHDLESAKIPSGVFLVREDASRGGAVLTAHTFQPLSQDRKRAIHEVLSADGKRRSRVVVHRTNVLRSTGSLAALDRRFAGGPIVYDPTAIFARAEHVIRCAAMIRAAVGKKVGQILMDTARRTLYVVLDGKAFAENGVPFRAETAAAVDAVTKTFAAWRASAPSDFEISVRIGFAAPGGIPLVPVDEKSRPNTQLATLIAMANRLRKVAGIAAIGAVAAGASTAALADGGDPTAAVSTTNATLIGQGWYHNGELSNYQTDWSGDAGAEIDLPLFHSFGLQAEGGAGTDNYYGGAGQLFWRDPNWGLVGGLFSHESRDGATMNRFAGEGEIYLNDWTLSGRGGYQEGTVEHGGWGRLDVGFYATPDFVLRAGFEDRPEAAFGRAGFEIQPAAHSWPGLSVFVDGDAGAHISGVKFGFKLHFGEAGGESLIYRDRHEDPLLAIFNDLPLAKHHYGH